MKRTPHRVLFVCLGNICRSPTAEGVLRHLAAKEAPDLMLEIDSAGTADYHIGSHAAPQFTRRSEAFSRIRARFGAAGCARFLYRDAAAFEEVLDLTLAASRGLLAALEEGA